MWVLLVLVVIVGLWVVSAYNGLISLKNQTVNAFKQIDVQLKRRHDLIPNLINAVKGAMDFERSTLEAVIQARNQAVQVNASGPEGIKQISQAENALSGALSRPLVTVERYPQLKATGNIGQLQEELTSTENRIAFARQLYNDTATQYNTKQQQFPTTIVAGLAHAEQTDLWGGEDQAERAVPQGDLSRRESLSTTGSQTPAHDMAGDWLRPVFRLVGIRRRLRLGTAGPSPLPLGRHPAHDGRDHHRVAHLQDRAGKGPVGDRRAGVDRSEDRRGTPGRERRRRDGHRRRDSAPAALDHPGRRPQRICDRPRSPRLAHRGDARVAEDLQPRRAPGGDRPRAGTRQESRCPFDDDAGRARRRRAAGPGRNGPDDARRRNPNPRRGRPEGKERGTVDRDPARAVDHFVDPRPARDSAPRARGEPAA